MIYQYQEYKNAIEREMVSINETLGFYLQAIPTIQKFDGKVANKKIRDALQELTSGKDRLYINLEKYEHTGNTWLMKVHNSPWLKNGYANYYSDQYLYLPVTDDNRVMAAEWIEEINKNYEYLANASCFMDETESLKRWKELEKTREKINEMIKDYKSQLTLIERDINNYERW